MPDHLFGKNVPIIGQKFRVASFHPLVNILCDCGENGNSALLTVLGLGVPTFCPICKQGYVIHAIENNQAQVYQLAKTPTPQA